MTMSLIASGTRSWRRCNWGDDVPRVLTARFMHETNTFSRVKTDMALIRRRDFHLENEIPQAFRGTRSALGATFEAADKYGWTLVHPGLGQAPCSKVRPLTVSQLAPGARPIPRRARPPNKRPGLVLRANVLSGVTASPRPPTRSPANAGSRVCWSGRRGPSLLAHCISSRSLHSSRAGRNRWFADSSLEGDGFELLVPRH